MIGLEGILLTFSKHPLIAFVIVVSLLFLVGCLIYLIVFSVVKGIRSVLNNSRRKKVEGSSKILAQIPSINPQYTFNNIKDCCCYPWILNSKRAFDTFDPYDAAMEEIEDREEYFEDWCEASFDNRDQWNAYIRAISQLGPSQYNKDTLVATERELVREAMLSQPVCDVRIEIHWSYASPKGRNRYEKQCVYGRNQILDMVERSYEIGEQRQSREYQIKRERALMTPKLRYEILRRDGFRCQICGSEQSDGVKLQVDHIVPVSRGGRTEPSNLRTLCDRCNLGKSDRIENQDNDSFTLE